MRLRLGTRHGGGFTLLEVLVVMAILMTAILVAFPALQNLIVRSKLEGRARELAAMVQRGRLEAVKRSVPVVVKVDPGSSEVFAFADVNGSLLEDPPDGIFNPVADEPHGATDYSLGRWVLPVGVTLAAPGAEPAIDGLTLVGSDRVVRLLPDGSVADVGAYRFGDPRGNFLEVRVAPRATARVSVGKWDGMSWPSRGEGGHPWRWK
jgi:prepilin-type N-terminal cleavage/methylation domain-containing protein